MDRWDWGLGGGLTESNDAAAFLEPLRKHLQRGVQLRALEIDTRESGV